MPLKARHTPTTFDDMSATKLTMAISLFIIFLVM